MSTSTKNKSKTRAPKNRARRQRQTANAKRKKQAVKSSLPIVSSLHIAPCTREYMKALVNPFQVKMQPCIPDTIILPSHKYAARTSGVLSTGVQGNGFVIFDPWKMAVSDNPPPSLNPDAAVVYSLPTYNNPNLQYYPTVAGTPRVGTAWAQSNSEFTYAFLTGGLGQRQMRLVAAGIKILFTGSSFRNQGRVVIYRSLGNTTVAPGTTSADYMQSGFTVMKPIRRTDEYVYYVPDDPTFLAYSTPNNYWASQGGIDHFAYLIYIDGGDTTTPQSWSFEAYAHFELLGPNLTLTASHGDSTGFNQVLANLSTKAPEGSAVAEHNSLLQRFKENFTSGATQLMYAGANTLMTQGLRYMSGSKYPALTSGVQIEEYND